jgi:arylsulfatase A-like enzyme
MSRLASFSSFKVIALIAFIFCPTVLLAADRPNVLLILTDDQGYGDVAIQGNTIVDTPRMDALARESVRFDQFYAQPVCSPTRATLMTGRQFLRTGVWGVHGGRDYLNPDEVTIAQHLANAGYRTAMFGKWHLGKTASYLPYNRGFERSWSITDRLYEHTDPVIDHNGKTLRPKGWTVDYLSDLAINFMRNDDARPFFAYLAYPQIHEPWHAPEDLVNKYKAKGLSESLATLYAMTEQMDAALGRVLDALDDARLADDTIVIFLGDNGPIGNAGNLPHLTDEEMATRNPLGLSKSKGQVYENGIRVPGYFRWPGRFKPRTLDCPADVVDVFPTLLDLLEVEQPPVAESLDGVSLRPLLEAKTDALHDRDLIYANHDATWPTRARLYDFLPGKDQLDFDQQVLAIRNGRYKMVQGWGGRALYDIVTDPREQNDIKAEQPELMRDMVRRLRVWYTQVLASDRSFGMPTYRIGSEAEPTTYVYACAPAEVYGVIVGDSHSTRVWSAVGHGEGIAINVQRSGLYVFKIDATPSTRAGRLLLDIADVQAEIVMAPGQPRTTSPMALPAGPTLLKLTVSQAEPGEGAVVEEMRGIEVRWLGIGD